MKIHEYNQMMAYLTRPATPTETPDTRQPAASGGRIELAEGTPRVSKNIRKTPYGFFRFETEANPPISKTFETLEEAEAFRDKALLERGVKLGARRTSDPKIGKYKSLEGQKQIKFNGATYEVLVQRAGKDIKPQYFKTLTEAKEARDNLVKEFPPQKQRGVVSDETLKKARDKRKTRIQTTAPFEATGTKKFQFHHIMPIGGEVALTTDDIAIVNSKMNTALSGFNRELNSISDGITNAYNKQPPDLKRIDQLNKAGESIVKKATTQLPKEYKNLIGFNKLNPIFDEYGTVINLTPEKVGGVNQKKPGIKLEDLTKDQAIKLKKQIKADAKAGKITKGFQLKASMIPGLDSLIDSVSSMPDDFKAKRYWTAGLKGLGIFVGTPLVVYDGYKAIRDGLPPDEVVAKALLGADKLLYEGKEILQLTPEEKKARTLIQQTRMTKQIAEDFSDLDSDFETPAVDTNLNLEEAKIKLKEGEDRYADFRKGKDAQVAENRKTAFSNLKTTAEDMLNPYANSETTYGFSDGGAVNIKDVIEEYNNGGRVGYADGPKDPKRRTVIKGLTALAALPVIGKYFKLAPKAGKIATVAMEKVSGMPNWFQPFVNKVLKMGDDVTDTAATTEREIVKRMDIEDATVDVHYNTATNDVRVEVAGGNKNAFGDPLTMEYKAPEVIEQTGKKTKGEFKAVETKPEAVQAGPDDFDLEPGENVTDVLDDLLSETDYLEGFTTGKIRTPNEIKKAKKRTFHRDNMEKNPKEYILSEDMANFSNPDAKAYETITDLDEMDYLLDLAKKKKWLKVKRVAHHLNQDQHHKGWILTTILLRQW